MSLSGCGKERGVGRGGWAGGLLCFQHHVLLQNSEEPEISKFEPGLPVCFDVTVNQEGI